VTPALRTLCLARLVSGFGDGITLVALTLLVAPRGPYAVSGLLLATTLPRLAGPLLGALGDRADARAVLTATALLQGLCVLLIAAAEPPLLVIGLLVAASAAGATVFAATVRRTVPEVAHPDRLAQANAWTSSAGTTSVLLGSAIGGLLFVAAGTRGALLVDAATFAGAALLLRTLPSLPPPGGRRTGLLADSRAGLAHVRADPAVRALVLGTFVLVAFLALDNVALVFLVTGELAPSPSSYGVVQAAYGAAMLLGSVAVLRRPRVAVKRWLVAGALLGAGGTVTTGLAPNVVVAGLGQAVAGSGNALDVIATDTLVQQLVPRGLLGRVGGTVGTAAQLGAAAAAAAGGPLLAASGPRTVFVVSGIGSLAALLVLLPVVRRG
jgi:MFS family permease